MLSTGTQLLCHKNNLVENGFYDSSHCGEAESESPGKKMILQLYAVTIILFDICVLLFRIIYHVCLSIYRCFIPPPMRSVEGEIVLVTGAGHGIGREISYIYARLGAKIVCTDLNLETATETASEIRKHGGQAWAYKCDVSDRHSVEQTADIIKRSLGNVTILVNNAGIMPCHPFLSWNAKQIDQCVDINVKGCLWVTRAFLPGMIEEKHGHIVSMSSIAGMVGCKNLVPYCASKYGVVGMMEALHEEIRQDSRKLDINFTTVSPFVVNTGLCKKPTVRFPSFTPILGPEAAAEAIVASQRRNERLLFIPRHFFYVWKWTRALPFAVDDVIKDFFKTGLEPHDD
ncbi:17-beta-hydroxysteroid dehydrogenase 13-like isoform X2 [Artemia franciscana]|uniref:Short-chain dehydrogenase/reductase 3 n=3 Tax=Artemia franciscana TaxID=6661 RepID=A0AA88IFE2_ARTSF|nr:hypothetical protein QYM36_000614 [Artemia franciscana]KAK2726218.1 hypothetical protein QYM36_000614 [Artemia franciscana]KAK2726219.1 hypothetical protein QYM36_000614 [Artemia franciscana]KAK2726221.1 hypothetical protein QYM36_000614 [Artemia franciscana]